MAKYWEQGKRNTLRLAEGVLRHETAGSDGERFVVGVYNGQPMTFDSFCNRQFLDADQRREFGQWRKFMQWLGNLPEIKMQSEPQWWAQFSRWVKYR